MQDGNTSNSPFPPRLNERIRLAREAAGLSRTELEERVGAGKGMLAKWEAGQESTESRNPKEGMLLKIAMATGVNWGWLKDLQGEMYQPGKLGPLARVVPGTSLASPPAPALGPARPRPARSAQPLEVQSA